MTPCETTREQAQAYLDGDLPAAERARLDSHLAECAACRRLVAGYRTLWAALAEPALPAPPADFAAGVLRRVAAARRRRAAWQTVAAAAVFVAAAAALILTFGDFLAGTAADLADLGVGDALSGAWSGLGDLALGFFASASQELSAAPSGFVWAALVVVLLIADIGVAYHWRSLARLNGGHKAGVTR